MKRLLLLVAILFSVQFSFAQEICGFDLVHDRMLKNDSNYARSVQAFTAKWAQTHGASNQNLINNGYGTEYEIPVVVHVIHTGGNVGTAYNPSDATINAAITYLNETYEASYASYPDTNNGGVRFPVKFVLAKRTETCGTTSGIIRVDGTSLSGYSANGMNLSNTSGADEVDVKALSKWDNGDYYNIWIVNKIDGHDGTTSGLFTAGFAYFPGASASVDGTVILASRVGAGYSTLPHEIGHAFNLYHTFQGDGTGSTCPPTTNCATTGDEVCDTDPHKRNQSVCPSNSSTNSCTGTTWAANQTQRNIMDYSSCKDRFTAGQRTRWLAALTGPRSGLASSLGGIAPPTTTTTAATCSTTINSTTASVAQNAGMGPVQIVLNDMTASSWGYGTDGNRVYIDRTCEQWATVTQGKTYTLSVNTETNAQDVQVYIDYNNNGSFVTGEKVMDHNTALSANGPETHSVSYTVPTSGITTCGPLRMRVVADWQASTHITNGCGQLDYGQAEDVTVYVKKAADTVTMTNAITSGSNPTCTTGSVTFTASTTKTLTSPSYQWYRNSIPVSGATSSTYTASSLSAGTYYVMCKIKYTNLCSQADSGFTNAVALVVNTSTVTPSVSIAANPGNTICSGTSVTFTATPTNGGAAPLYQWKVNGTNVGSNTTTNTYTSTTLSNSDVVTCVMTSNASCVSPTTATSAGITMSVTPSVTPSVAIAANPGTTICAGTSVTFTATPTNGGAAPLYQWKLNGTNVGGNTTTNTYTNATLTNSDVVSCVMTSNASCASPTTATSSNLTMSVSASVTPSVSIGASTSTTICSGTSVTFTATPTNGGTAPLYQWKVNGTNVGANTTTNTYTSTTLANSDVVSCVMTSNDACASPTTATSTGITMTVNPTVTPSVTIGANPGNTVCSGLSVTFTAIPTNGGAAPLYQWKVNGTNVGGNTTTNTYTSSTLANNDQVTCVMTSNATCASPTTATSAGITMVTTGTVVPAVSIAANTGNTICAGTSVTFTATPTNGGSGPLYQWKLNGTNVGGNTTTNTYTSTTLSNNDVVSCVMTSALTCASPSTATSSNVTMTVNSTVTPSVAIAANPGNTICSGTSVTFTATPTNGGTAPLYQWKVNGTNVGANTTTNTYTSTTLSNNDVVTCVMTSTETCVTAATATSTGITMSVTSTIVPTITISNVAPNDTVCAGTLVGFVTTSSGGGSSPTYQWKVNGTNVGTNSASYSSSALLDGDVVTCEMTSSETCASPTTAVSTGVTMTINPNLTPAVNITVGPNDTICAGTTITFTAAPTNGGATPSYRWRKNGTNIAGALSGTYTTNFLSDGDIFSAILISSEACLATPNANSNDITMKVNPNLTPSVSISASPSTTICAGASVTFTATPTNGGTSPLYQWKVNGTNVGGNTTTNTYTTTTLSNTDVVSCVVTSNETCLATPTGASNNITMTVNPNLTPTVSIAANPGNTICSGALVTFTATPTNGGASPSYQWKVNGTNIGGNSATFATTTLTNGDAVTCVMTSNATCLATTTGTSSAITMTVNPNLTPSVSISVGPNDTICAGSTVTFTATPTNGGTAPSYQWKRNGVNTGTNSSTYTLASPTNGDVITCVMTSNETCLATPTGTSNSIRLEVKPNLTPAVSISVTPNDTICAGTSVTYTAVPTNGGATPTYQWKVNGTNVGTGGNTYTSTTLANNDVVTCVMTSSEQCVTSATGTSNSITMTVNPNLVPFVTITVSPNDTICAGTSVTFTSSSINGGATPSYRWLKNGTNIGGATSSTYSSSTLADGDVIVCRLISSETCLATPSANSAGITMEVIPNVTPSVTIAVSPKDTICDGDLANFTATPVNNGTSATFQWKLNGTNVGGNSFFYSNSNLSNNDVVSCEMTSSLTCVTKQKDTSNNIAMTVIPLTIPTVSVSTNVGTTTCKDGTVIFSSSYTNGGTSRSYQWKLNNVDIAGAINPTYTTTTLNNGDKVHVEMTIVAACPAPATVQSDTPTMSVINPVFTISVSPNDTICSGTPAMFAINATDAGNNPQYQWYRNSLLMNGVTSSAFTILNPNNGDAVTARFTGSDNCVNAPLSMDTAKIGVTQRVTPSVVITADPSNNVPPGLYVTFKSVTNARNPIYQWRKNGVDIPGATGDQYTTNTLVTNDTISLLVKTTDSCANVDSALSNDIQMLVGVSVKEIKTRLFDDITLSPNPNSGVFVINGKLMSNLNTDEIEVDVINSIGQVVHRGNIEVNNGEFEYRIDLQDKSHSGMHVVRLHLNGRVHYLKFITNK